MQYSDGLTIEQLQNGFLLRINNKNLFDFLWVKFAKDFGHERFMTNVSVNSSDYRIHIRDLEAHVLDLDLERIPPHSLNQYV
ncbi:MULTISPECIES: hypothetical protein [Acinetobacter calcoaceticus/baumannii complex]|uniref:Uncharacterized protein n=1 Tax=Acinetobacter pittii TaxID=48296 RepID=A0A1S8XD73_ACIPI|nr:hypothetical protein [Acinetobacter pittii]AQV15305.1 hypothetical protein BMU11_06960 [Acinetobacter pittii]MDX8163065.1 hypothetical protein [Acinetobacter pittii]OON24688.1 hypothetical protein BI372_15215 [Acinetobacter pittii]QIT19094.1 hypothetical protein G8E09_16045 [Acinetobacter pittii]